MSEPRILIAKIPFEEGFEETSSIILDKIEFDELIDKTEYFTHLSEKDKKSLKDKNYIPIIIQNTQTKWIFEKYKIQTNWISATPL